jgi:hypothetical protein
VLLFAGDLVKFCRGRGRGSDRLSLGATIVLKHAKSIKHLIYIIDI